jgi:hypothetical protein
MAEIIMRSDFKPLTEHKDKAYYLYYNNLSTDVFYLKFAKKWQMEEFIYKHGIKRFTYKSSNGSTIEKVFEYIPSKLEYYKDDVREKYDYWDWCCGHFVKEK